MPLRSGICVNSSMCVFLAPTRVYLVCSTYVLASQIEANCQVISTGGKLDRLILVTILTTLAPGGVGQGLFL